ncbi:MAG: hypothetical protein MI754_06185, partial [Chromatiales bacterium]|nr:hypothetical protein [Chromatiales bacterium]
MRIKIFWCLCLLLLVGTSNLSAAERLKPFVLGNQVQGEMVAVVDQVKERLQEAGLSVVGEYVPYDGAHIIVVTNDYLKRLVGRQPNAAYLAGLRVSVTKTPAGVQVAYMNPRYFSHAYRVDENLQAVASLLENTLGAKESFGAKGLSAKKLRKYQYG